MRRTSGFYRLVTLLLFTASAMNGQALGQIRQGGAGGSGRDSACDRAQCGVRSGRLDETGQLAGEGSPSPGQTGLNLLLAPVMAPLGALLTSYVIWEDVKGSFVRPCLFKLAPKERIPFDRAAWLAASGGFVVVNGKKKPRYYMFRDLALSRDLKAMSRKELIELLGNSCAGRCSRDSALEFAGGPVGPYKETTIVVTFAGGHVAGYYLGVPEASFGTGYINLVDFD